MLKIWTYIRWFFLSVIIAGILTILAYIIYPISYILKDSLRKWYKKGNLIQKIFSFPLWIFLNDEDDYGQIEPYWYSQLNMSTKLNRFISSYKWAVIRNPAWNMYEIIKPKKGDEVLISYNGYISENGIQSPPSHMASFKWANEQGEWVGNQGFCISPIFSLIGTAMYWYKINGTLYFRYSFAKTITNKNFQFLYRIILSIPDIFNKGKLVKIWNNPIFLEKHLGTTTKRYTIRIKIKSALFC